MRLRDILARRATRTAAGSVWSTCTSSIRKRGPGSSANIEIKQRAAQSRGAAAHPRPPQRGRGVRDDPADQILGQKRFTLEGGERPAPMIEELLRRADQHPDEVVIGMPHRGRLNVLANIVGKPYGKIFNEFEGNIDPARARLRRREVPPRRRRHVPRAERQPRSRLAHLQPVPPRSGRPGPGRHRAGQAGHARTRAKPASPSCRCSCTATPRSPARASSPRR